MFIDFDARGERQHQANLVCAIWKDLLNDAKCINCDTNVINVKIQGHVNNDE